MKEITVKIRDDDYEWLLSRAQEIIEKFSQGGMPLSFTAEELIQKSLHDRALRSIGRALYYGRKEADILLRKAVKK